MQSILDELKEMLELEYLSDLRYLDNQKVMRCLAQLEASGNYTTVEIKKAKKYLLK